MADWQLTYAGYTPAEEGRRETLCALGNGYIVSRAAQPDAAADDVHYPGTYLAGGYNRLTSEVSGRAIENEDLVNLPNWLPLAVAIGDDAWLTPDSAAELLDYTQTLDLHAGVLRRDMRLQDGAGRILRWQEERFVSMDDPHLAALRVTLTAENFAGRLRLRAAIDGGVINWGVKRYRALDGRHMEVLTCQRDPDGVQALRSRMRTARREIALAARTVVTAGGTAVPGVAEVTATEVADIFEIDAAEGVPITAEKIAAYYNSQDFAIAEPLLAATDAIRRGTGFDALRAAHARAWAQLWDQADIRLTTRNGNGAQQALRLHIFHLLQTASEHSKDIDAGIPPRGWTGEAYRGHILWDELYILPYLTLRMPGITRHLLWYRYRRLDAARRAAAAAGHRGAMFPWQSGSDGREETQQIHLNPKSGRWIADNSWRQRHVGAAIAYNVWQYFEATADRAFLRDAGAELFLEIARFWASLAERRPDGRYGITGVMGPDEFHTAYPGADPDTEGGLDNNAYSNFMAAWILTRAIDVLDWLPGDARARLCVRIGLDEAELAHWQEIGRKLVIPFHDGVISQFEGYGDLKEFDWPGYRAKYGDIQRLDRVLEAEGDDPNNYKVSKQADALMIFYLFSRAEIARVFERLGYDFRSELIPDTIRYYEARTSHGSTLSFLAHAWVLARSDRQRSWELALTALESDIADIQDGTTPEGIHLGAMAGTVDLIQRCYTGIEMRPEALALNPRLPEEVTRLEMSLVHHHHVLDITVTQEELTVASRPAVADPMTILYRGWARPLPAGQSFTIRLIPEPGGG
jgi:alpha,alpha-trehalase